jgi:hypothetical protein
VLYSWDPDGAGPRPPVIVAGGDRFGSDDVGVHDPDIAAYFACLSGNCCATCGSDFNGDGDIGTDVDIEAFFRVLSGGIC